MDIRHDDVVRVVSEVWETAVGLPAQPDDAPTPDTGPRVVGKVSIRGTCRAEVTLGCDADLARRAAATFFDVPEVDVTREMIHDAVGELANMTGGQLKALLPEGCTLSTPITREGTDGGPDTGTGFQAAGRPFTVAVTSGGS